MAALPKLVVITAALALLVGGLTYAPPEAAAAPGCDQQSGKMSPNDTVDKNRHPLVLIHGWVGGPDNMRPVADGITERQPNKFTYHYFDYRSANTDWAASPRVASCLAHYLTSVSQAHRAAGGSGKVYVVAHSMGGLATRFATDSRYTDSPVGPDILGGLTTIDTPHLGSPFGGRPEGDLWESVNEWANSKLLPDANSNAAHCLAIHDSDHPLPSDCPSAPYLPNGIPVGQISGNNVVSRTLFGVPLYDIDLRSDGVVGVDSATGYLRSGPAAAPSPQYPNGYMKDVSCTTTTDQTLELLRSFNGGNVPLSIISAEIKAIALLAHDSSVLDQVNSGQLGPNLEAMLLVAAVLYNCSHSAMLSNDESLDAVVASLQKQSASRDPS